MVVPCRNTFGMNTYTTRNKIGKRYLSANFEIKRVDED